MPKPVGREVSIKVKTLKEKTQGGIILDTGTRDVHNAGINVGEVVELGPYAYWYDSGFKPACQVGDKVYFVSYVGFKIPCKETDDYYIRMVPEDAIKGIVEETDACNDVEFVVGLRNN